MRRPAPHVETPHGAGRPDAATAPDVDRRADSRRSPIDVRSLALTGLFVLACAYTLYAARAFLLPVVLAVLLKFLLEPVRRSLGRLRVPPPAAAALLVGALLVSVGTGLVWLREPASTWLDRLPEVLERIGSSLASVRGPVEQLNQAAEQVEEMAGMDQDGEQPAAAGPALPPLRQIVVLGAWNLIGGAAIAVILLYFLLASGDFFLRRVVQVLPRLKDKRRAVEVARQIEEDVSRHLLTVTLINFALGAAVALALHLVGMPNPLLWGLLAALLNYIPYLGPLVGTIVVGAVAFLTFEQPERVALAVATFVGLTAFEGNFLTPTILGRRLALNPVAVFLNLCFWGWIWGPVGALIAVPMLVAFRALCDQVEPLAPVGEFLGR